MKEFWNERYAKSEFAYGKKPNQFLENQISRFNPGKILLPFEGEGRNAVFCAKQAWKVDAFDFSLKGKEKAEQLSKINKVTLHYKQSELNDFNFKPDEYDAVALIYAHPSPENRSYLHQKVIDSLKKGGKLILEAFSTEQISRNHISGGPKKKEMLFTKEMLQNDFKDLKIESLQNEFIYLDEGVGHQGEAHVIRMVAQK